MEISDEQLRELKRLAEEGTPILEILETQNGKCRIHGLYAEFNGAVLLPLEDINFYNAARSAVRPLIDEVERLRKLECEKDPTIKCEVCGKDMTDDPPMENEDDPPLCYRCAE